MIIRHHFPVNHQRRCSPYDGLSGSEAEGEEGKSDGEEESRGTKRRVGGRKADWIEGEDGRRIREDGKARVCTGRREDTALKKNIYKILG